MGLLADINALNRAFDSRLKDLRDSGSITDPSTPEVATAVLAQALSFRRKAGSNLGRLGERLEFAKQAATKLKEFEDIQTGVLTVQAPSPLGARVNMRRKLT